MLLHEARVQHKRIGYGFLQICNATRVSEIAVCLRQRLPCNQPCVPLGKFTGFSCLIFLESIHLKHTNILKFLLNGDLEHQVPGSKKQLKRLNASKETSGLDPQPCKISLRHHQVATSKLRLAQEHCQVCPFLPPLQK